MEIFALFKKILGGVRGQILPTLNGFNLEFEKFLDGSGEEYVEVGDWPETRQLEQHVLKAGFELECVRPADEDAFRGRTLKGYKSSS